MADSKAKAAQQKPGPSNKPAANAPRPPSAPPPNAPRPPSAPQANASRPPSAPPAKATTPSHIAPTTAAAATSNTSSWNSYVYELLMVFISSAIFIVSDLVCSTRGMDISFFLIFVISLVMLLIDWKFRFAPRLPSLFDQNVRFRVNKFLMMAIVILLFPNLREFDMVSGKRPRKQKLVYTGLESSRGGINWLAYIVASIGQITVFRAFINEIVFAIVTVQDCIDNF